MIYSLNSYARKEEVGNKAFRLMQLARSNYNVPKGFVVVDNYDKINQYDIEYPVVVRSSGIGEDSKIKSFAGQYDSILNVRSLDELIKAIEKVKNSSKKDLGNYANQNQKMAVIVQKQIEAKYSGVFFTQNPTKKGFLIEYVNGHLSDMVSGKVNSYKIEENPKKPFDKIYSIGRQIEEFYNEPQDIEFIIDNEEKTWVVQARPITSIKYSQRKIKENKTEFLKGITLSRGDVKGKIQFIYDDLDPKEAQKVFQKGNILATYVLFPEYNKVYQKASGVVCMVDSITSHPAIISRELNIPCLGGVNVFKLSRKVKDLDEIILKTSDNAVYYNPRIKNVDESFEITKSTYEPTKKYLQSEENIKNYIKNLDYENLDLEIKNSFSVMRDNFKKYLKDKDKINLKESKSYLYNLSHLLKNDFILSLKNRGYSHDELVEIFSNVDRGIVNSDIEKVYKVLKDAIQNLDSNAKIGNKSIWDIQG